MNNLLSYLPSLVPRRERVPRVRLRQKLGVRPAALAELSPRDHPVAVDRPDPAPLVGQARVQGDVRREPRVRPYEVRAVDARSHEALHKRDELDFHSEVDLCVFDLEVGDANVLVSLHAIAETATPRRRCLLDGVHATPSTRRLGLHAIGRARDANGGISKVVVVLVVVCVA